TKEAANRYVQPTATAPHLDSTRSCGWRMSGFPLLLGGKQTFGELPENDAHDPNRTFGRIPPSLDKLPICFGAWLKAIRIPHAFPRLDLECFYLVEERSEAKAHTCHHNIRRRNFVRPRIIRNDPCADTRLRHQAGI